MKNKLSVLAIVLSLLALGSAYLPKSAETTTIVPVKESTYDRLMRTRTIRCAYLLWPPYLSRDAATGKMSGVYYDLLERMAKDWSMKVEWSEEVGTANRFEGFKTGRYDLLCAPVGGTPERTAVAAFSRPFVYNPFYLYVRGGDARFDNAYEKVNDESMTMITLDGYIGSSITKDYFPKAKLTSLPNLSSDAEILMSISMGKADASVCDSVMATDYVKNNPGKVQRAAGPPVRVATETIAFSLNEEQLRTKIDTTLTYYLDTGVIEKILNANGLDTGKVLRVAKPYAEMPSP